MTFSMTGIDITTVSSQFGIRQAHVSPVSRQEHVMFCNLFNKKRCFSFLISEHVASLAGLLLSV